jgi:ribosomal protein S27AE
VSDEDDFDELGGFEEPLDEHESAMIQQDLSDLADFEATFRSEGYRGVAVWCQDCVEEHFYPWEMLRENLQLLLDTGETPVHEPAFAPEPDRYVQWDYARGYVDALRDAGVADRADLDHCGRCGFELSGPLRQGNFCPRCGHPLLGDRLRRALADAGLDEDTVRAVLRRSGLVAGAEDPPS